MKFTGETKYNGYVTIRYGTKFEYTVNKIIFLRTSFSDEALRSLETSHFFCPQRNKVKKGFGLLFREKLN